VIGGIPQRPPRSLAPGELESAQREDLDGQSPYGRSAPAQAPSQSMAERVPSDVHIYVQLHERGCRHEVYAARVITALNPRISIPRFLRTDRRVFRTRFHSCFLLANSVIFQPSDLPSRQIPHQSWMAALSSSRISTMATSLSNPLRDRTSITDGKAQQLLNL